MPFIPAANTAEVAMEWTTSGGAKSVNVFHVREKTLSTWTISSLTALCQIVRDWDATNASAHRSNEVTLQQVRARDLTTQNGLVVTLNQPVIGALASPALPSNVTIALSLRTGYAGRSYRGRIFYVGLAESQVVGNYITSTAAADIIADYNDLKNTVLTAQGSLVIVSKYHLGAARPAAVVTDVTQIMFADLKIDTQRRRLD